MRLPCVHAYNLVGMAGCVPKKLGDANNAERRAKGQMEIHGVYASAGHEVRPWLYQIGTSGLLAFIDKMNAGEPFETVYRHR